ncbi:POK8 protein, partial [Penelope pileata]|nr:POK8 protein [Penelope pileata]
LKIIDLKDCFFTIPLHPKDCERFMFSVLVINNAEPMTRYHWTVLPQGLMSSPTICQIVVATAINPTRKLFPSATILHYMDAIAGEKKEVVDAGLEHMP